MFVSALPDPTCNSEKSANGGNKQILLLLLLLLWSSILSLSIKRYVCFVYPGIPRDSSSNINAFNKETLDNLSPAFSDVALNVEYKLNIKRIVEHIIQNYI